MDFVTFTIIIDDIVFPDGRTAMCCLGGGGPQTSFGIRLFSREDERIGLAAGIGSDFPDTCLDWLKKMSIETSGLLQWPHPTLRAWQIFEEDGLRTQVWRVPMVDDMLHMLRPSFHSLPIHYQKSASYHICVHPSTRDVDFIHQLKKSNALTVSVEPYTRAESILTRTELHSLISAGDIFSPNEDEAFSLVGPGPPLDVIDRMAELGAKIICLRRGPLGVIVQKKHEVPAFYTVFGVMSKEELILSIISSSSSSSSSSSFKNVDGLAHRTKDRLGQTCSETSLRGSDQDSEIEFGVELLGVKDVTGCGNTFCGGFLSAWMKTNDILYSALCGSVAASFMLEYEGVPEPSSHFFDEAKIRVSMLRRYSKQLSIQT